MASGLKGILSNFAEWGKKSIEIKLTAREIRDIFETLPEFLEKITDLEVAAIFRDLFIAVKEAQRAAAEGILFGVPDEKPLEKTSELMSEWYKWIRANLEALNKYPEAYKKIIPLMRLAIKGAKVGAELGERFFSTFREILKTYKEADEATKEIGANLLAINLALKKQYQEAALAAKYAHFQAEGYDKAQIALMKQNDLIDVMVKRLKETKLENIEMGSITADMTEEQKKGAKEQAEGIYKVTQSAKELRKAIRQYVADVKDKGPVEALENLRKKIGFLANLSAPALFAIVKAGYDSWTASIEKIRAAEEKRRKKEIAGIEHTFTIEKIGLQAREATQSELHAQEIKRCEEVEKKLQSQLDGLNKLDKEGRIILENKKEQAERTTAIARANKESAALEAKRVIYNRQIALAVAEAQMMGKTRLEQLKIEEAWIWKTKGITEAKRAEYLNENLQQRKLAEYDEEKLARDREFELVAANIAVYGGTQLEQLNAQLELAIALGDTERERALTYQIQIERLKEQEQLSRDIQSTLVSGISALLNGTGEWKDLLRDINNIFLKKCLESLVEMVFQTQLMQTVLGGFLGIFSPAASVGTAVYPTNIPIGTSVAAEGGIMPGGFSPIRQLANGDIITRPTLGLVGEGKYDEAVIPLSRGRSIPVDMRGGQQPLNLTLVNIVDPSFVPASLLERKDVVINIINEDLLRNGMSRKTMQKTVG